MYDNACEPCCEMDKSWEAECAKKMPECICLARKLVREMGLKPQVALCAAAQQCEVPEFRVSEELIRLGLL